MADKINPDYYQAGGYDLMKVMEAFKLTPAEANAVKYIVRSRHKNGKEDRIKALRAVELKIEAVMEEYGD